MVSKTFSSPPSPSGRVSRSPTPKVRKTRKENPGGGSKGKILIGRGFLEQAPLRDTARRDILRLETDRIEYLQLHIATGVPSGSSSESAANLTSGQHRADTCRGAVIPWRTSSGPVSAVVLFSLFLVTWVIGVLLIISQEVLSFIFPRLRGQSGRVGSGTANGQPRICPY
jgi:hypothetical protein